MANTTEATKSSQLGCMLSGMLQWRFVGPYRGGRVNAVCGHPTDPMLFYMGSSSGGVWKTTNGGHTWNNVSDGYFERGSVGALAIADVDPNIIYAGMGACGMRSNVTHGDGLYKSTDAGETWEHMGLAETHNIRRVRVHPTNPDLVYVAAFGHRFGPNAERGVYRSVDGGTTWERVLFKSRNTGAIDLVVDPSNPRILYAAMWQARLFPWGRNDTGPESGVWKTTDGGDTWTELTSNPGFPKGDKGRIGLCVSPNLGRIWALVPATNGGIYRSDDGGKTWRWVSDNPQFLGRTWYFGHLIADPQNDDIVYVPNRKLWKSVDGGRTYVEMNTPYVDQHDFWVDPRNPSRLIVGNDGGAAVSFDGGVSWSTLLNQPTAEIYRAAVDNRFPYNVYGSQMDNSTLSMPSRSDLGPISQLQWYDVGGGESGYIVVHPDDPDIVYSSDLPGLGVTRYDHRNHQLQEVAPWLEREGLVGQQRKYRFNWSTPVALSPHDANVLYVAGNYVFRSTDEGRSWEIISPDLTRNDQAKLNEAEGSHTGKQIVVDYCTISTFAESPCTKGVLWAGSDDGLIHVSRDNGATWANVTPEEMPDWAITRLEASAHAPGHAYVSATAHRLDDFRPYVFKTANYGEDWELITDGIPDDQFVRVVREDPARHGLLYAGTEAGIYMSLDHGASWLSLQIDLPVAAVYDIVVKHGDLLVATHGRGLWILDDLTPLHEWEEQLLQKEIHLFAPRSVTRVTRQAYGLSSLLAMYHHFAAKNPPAGVIVNYYLKDEPAEEVTLTLLDSEERVVSTVSSESQSRPPSPAGPFAYELQGGWPVLTGKVESEEPGVLWGPLTWSAEDGSTTLPTAPGLNRFALEIRYPGARQIPGDTPTQLTSPLAPPGTYELRLKVGERTWTQPVEITKDPRVSTSEADLEAQFALMIQIRDKIAVVYGAVREIRKIRQQLEASTRHLPDLAETRSISQSAEAIEQKLAEIEERLVQTAVDVRSGEEQPWSLRPGLDEKLGALAFAVSRSDDAPTEQSCELLDDLSARVDQQLDLLRELVTTDLRGFNDSVRATDLPAVITSWTQK